MARGLITALLLAALAIAPAQAREVALVVANSQYEATTRLPNPPSDAKLVGQALRDAGFDEVIEVSDVDFDSFRKALRDFGKKSRGADTALIYYAGHGIEGKGENWLVPTNAKLASASDLAYEAIELELALDALHGAKLRIALIDACRDNPFARNWEAATRSMPQGLAAVERDSMLVIFAAAPGQQALDGAGDNSPFAQSLAKRLVELEPVQMLSGMVRDDVLDMTGKEQRPFISGSVGGKKLYLTREQQQSVAKAARSIAAPLAAAAGIDEAAVDKALDKEGWKAAKSIGTREAFETYIEIFPNGIFRKFAELEIKKL